MPRMRIEIYTPETRELKLKNDRLQDKLREVRREKEWFINLTLAITVLFGISSTLLALTWAGFYRN